MERNVRLFPAHHALAHTLPWLPIFVLFTRDQFDLDGALNLAAIYYLAAVITEVPSGWLSDRVGRVVTLRFAALAWIAAHVVFLAAGDRFAAVVVGQCLMAVGFSSISGTDVALHYDSLESLGREGDYETRQARAVSLGLLASAVGTLGGGALGLWSLRLAFAASLVLAVAQFAISLSFTEPVAPKEAAGFHRQLGACLGLLRHRLLGWVFLYWVAMVVLEHVAATLGQPYLTEALERPLDDLGATPLLVGALMAASSLIGAGAARISPMLRQRWGLVRTLLLLAVVSAIIVTAMSATIHLALLALMVFRNAQGAAAPVLMTAAAAPLVEPRQRATYFSLHSLAGRLSYSTVLFVVAATVGDDLTASLRALAGVAWASVGLVLAAFWLLGRPRPADDPYSTKSS